MLEYSLGLTGHKSGGWCLTETFWILLHIAGGTSGGRYWGGIEWPRLYIEANLAIFFK